MDKSTLSNYGWVVIAILVISVMIALATPFGNFIANGAKATLDSFTTTIGNSLGWDPENMGKLTFGSNGTNDTGNKDFDQSQLPVKVPEPTFTLLINPLTEEDVYSEAANGKGSDTTSRVRVTTISKSELNLDSYINKTFELKVKHNNNIETITMQYDILGGYKAWAGVYSNNDGMVVIFDSCAMDYYYTAPTDDENSYTVFTLGQDGRFGEHIKDIEYIEFLGHKVNFKYNYYSLIPVDCNINNVKPQKIILSYSDNTQHILDKVYNTAPNPAFESEVNIEKSVTKATNKDSIAVEILPGYSEVALTTNANKTLKLITVEHDVGGETVVTTFKVLTMDEYIETIKVETTLANISVIPIATAVADLANKDGISTEEALWKVVLSGKADNFGDFHADKNNYTPVYNSKEEYLAEKGMTVEEFAKAHGFESYASMLSACGKLKGTNPYLLSTFYSDAKTISFDLMFNGYTDIKRQDNLQILGLDSGDWNSFLNQSLPETPKIKAWIDNSNVLHIAGMGPIKAGADLAYYFAPYKNANGESGSFSGVTNINFNGVLDTSNTINMDYMFKGCTSISTLDLTSFKTSNVKTAIGMFDGMNAITLKISKDFNLKNLVTGNIVVPSGSNIVFNGTYAEFKTVTANKLTFQNNTGTITCTDQTVTV